MAGRGVVRDTTPSRAAKPAQRRLSHDAPGTRALRAVGSVTRVPRTAAGEPGRPLGGTVAAGYPIATGVIEGACRHLVRDRMELTGARWRLVGAEAVLKQSVVEPRVRSPGSEPGAPVLRPYEAGGARMILTTTPGIEGRTIRDYRGIVTGEAIVGANIFKDFFAGIRDIVGGRSAAYERELQKARDLAFRELEDAARRQGANAVVGVDLDYEVVGQGGSMLMVTISGTAVTIG